MRTCSRLGRVRASFGRAPHALRSAGSASGPTPPLVPTSRHHSPESSCASHAFAKRQSLSTVLSDTPSDSAISSCVSPP